MRSRALAVVAVVVCLVLVAPVSATAAQPVSVRSAIPPDFTPSPGKWREWLLNITGSVLGAAMPDKWKAEQIANAHRYNFSWDQLASEFGYSANSRNANGDLMPIPERGSGTYDDHVIDAYEKQLKKGGTGGRPFTGPSSKVKGLAKLLGGAAVVYMAYDTANYLGMQGANLVGSAIGVDTNGIVCGYSGNAVSVGMVRFLSGQDCSAYDFATDYVVNADAGITGDLTFGTWSISYLGSFKRPTDTERWGCYRYTGTLGSAYYTSPPIGGGSFMADLCYSFGMNSNGWANVGSGAAVSIFRHSDGVKVAQMALIQDDPLRQYECKVTYTDNTTASGWSTPFKESAGKTPAHICPNTPKGKTPKKTEVIDHKGITGGTGGSLGGGGTDGSLGTPGTGGTTEKVQESEVTPEYQDWWETYPECRTGACKLDLLVDTGSQTVSCFDLEDGCVNWHTDPNKATVYTCRYGAHDVALEECNVYAGLFQPGRLATGSPYTDPTTGEWSGGQNAPTTDSTTMGRLIQNPNGARSCKYGSNPAGWFLEGGQCLMEWAFVPRPVVVETHFAGGGEAWEGKPPAVIAEAVTGLTPAVSGCSKSAQLFGVSFDVLNTCSGVMASLAQWSRWITSAGMVLLVLALLRRQIAGMVGYNEGQS